MRIEHGPNMADTVEFSYYAEAEPKLEQIRAALDLGTTNEIEAHAEIVELVGPRRYFGDFDRCAMIHPCPKDRDPQIWALECFEAQLPEGDLRRRLYGYAAVKNVETLLGFQSRRSDAERVPQKIQDLPGLPDRENP